MKTLEQLLTIGTYAGLGLVLTCTADNQSKTTDSDTEYVSGDSGSDSCVAWEQTFGGSEDDYIFSVQQTNDGGYVLAGFTDSSGGESHDGWLIKTDENGNKQWEQTFGGSDYYNFIYSVQQTTDEGYVLAGMTESSGAGNIIDGWLVKTDADGSKQWEQTFGESDHDRFNSVQQTTDGGYVLAGDTYSSGVGSIDGWLVKTDADGNKQWEQTFGGSEGGHISSVQQTTDGGYVLAGDTYSSGAWSDGWLVKTDVDGNKQWEQTFGGSEDDYIRSLQQTTDGGYVLAGMTESSGAGNIDGWLVKTDVNGNKQWEQTFGESDYDRFNSVQQTTDGGYVLAGDTSSSGAGNYDGWLIKTDKNGNKQWEQTFGGSDSDEIHSLQQTTDGGYVLAGYTRSSGAGNNDGWLVKACDK